MTKRKAQQPGEPPRVTNKGTKGETWKKMQANPFTRKGRPLKRIPWAKVGQMFRYQCTVTEVCALLEYSQEHLYSSCLKTHGIPLDQWAAKWKMDGNRNLRKAMYNKAVQDKDFQAMKWLSQHQLGMNNDNQSLSVETTGKDGGVKITFASVKMPRSTPQDTTSEGDPADA